MLVLIVIGILLRFLWGIVSVRLNLSLRQYPLHQIQKLTRILRRPEIDIQRMQPQKIGILAVRVIPWQTPFIHTLRVRRRWKRRGIGIESVHGQGAQRRKPGGMAQMDAVQD